MALIGKDISHSRSEEVYKNLLEEKINYQLLDYQNSDSIPTLYNLLKEIPRISITAPYKNYIFKNIDLFPNNDLGLESVNAIKLVDEKVIGINTDILAFQKIFNELDSLFKKSVTILGDGNMAQMIAKYFTQQSIEYNILSRKNGKLDSFEQHYEKEKLIINCCSRNYQFRHKLESGSYFWNMNYSQPDIENHIASTKSKYLDGYSLLIEQAKFALSFWN